MATAAGAIIAKARREVEDLFWDNNAFSPGRAIEFKPRVPVQQSYLELMIGEGIVHEATPGRYWFDLPAYKAMRRERLLWGLRILAVAAIVAVVLYAIQSAGYLQ